MVSRVIEAACRVVFDAYSDPTHLSRWWGPNGFSITTRSFDFRPGGVWEFTMHGPDGTDYPNWVRYLEIARPERIVLLHGSEPDDPEAFTSTVSIEDRGEHCAVTLRSIFKTRAQRDEVVERYRAIEGAEQTLARLADHIRPGGALGE